MKVKFILFYLLLICTIYFLLFNLFQYLFFQDALNHDFSDKLDIVITWVEADEAYVRDKNFWLKREIKMLDEKEIARRSTDNKELKYSLRSIEKFFPYYNKIYLVIKDGQFPKYIKERHPRLVIIKESDIMPNEYLPTFNSMAIEPYLHHIPNLSDNYIYMNDDFIFLKPTNKSYFLDKNYKPTPLYTSNKKRKFINEYEIDLNDYNFETGYAINNFILDSLGKEEREGRYLVSHVPKIFNRKYDYEIEKRLKNHYIDDEEINVYDKTGMSKFRKNGNLYLVSILKEYLYHYWFDCKFKKTNHIFQKIFNLSKLKNNKNDNQFLCINEINKKDLDDYHKYMLNIFPKKSSFEK